MATPLQKNILYNKKMLAFCEHFFNNSTTSKKNHVALSQKAIMRVENSHYGCGCSSVAATLSSFGEIIISTLLFFSLPSSVRLSAIGLCSPYARITIL